MRREYVRKAYIVEFGSVKWRNSSKRSNSNIRRNSKSSEAERATLATPRIHPVVEMVAVARAREEAATATAAATTTTAAALASDDDDDDDDHPGGEGAIQIIIIVLILQ